MMEYQIKRNYNPNNNKCVWETPQNFFDKLNEEFHFTLDPCCSETNKKCSKFFTPEQDGLKQDWSKYIVFMNPPYNALMVNWIKKAYEESLKGAIVVCLLPANRSDTSWWWNYCMKGEIRYIKGRLKFKGINAKGESCISPATFPSVLVIFRPKNNEVTTPHSPHN